MSEETLRSKASSTKSREKHPMVNRKRNRSTHKLLIQSNLSITTSLKRAMASNQRMIEWNRKLSGSSQRTSLLFKDKLKMLESIIQSKSQCSLYSLPSSRNRLSKIHVSFILSLWSFLSIQWKAQPHSMFSCLIFGGLQYSSTKNWWKGHSLPLSIKLSCLQKWESWKF